MTSWLLEKKKKEEEKTNIANGVNKFLKEKGHLLVQVLNHQTHKGRGKHRGTGDTRFRKNGCFIDTIHIHDSKNRGKNTFNLVYDRLFKNREETEAPL